MSEYTVEIPFKTLGNKSILTYLQLANEPHLAAFVKRFPNCFEHAHDGHYVIFYPEGILNNALDDSSH